MWKKKDCILFKYLGITLTNQNSIAEEINPLTPNDDYSGRTAPLTSKQWIYVIIQQI